MKDATDLALRLVPAINDLGSAVSWPGRALLGRTAVVTSSLDGIGLDISRALAAQGAAVMLNGVVCSRQAEDLRAAMAAEYRVRVGFAAANMEIAQQAADLVSQAQAEFGRLDILVNCTALATSLPFIELAIGAALPGMKSRHWGRIVNVASGATHDALLGLTQGVSLACAGTGVTCNAIDADGPDPVGATVSTVSRA